MKPKLIVYVDGLGFDMVTQETTPFLYGWGLRNNLCRLKTLLAYTGIEYGFATGKYPDESGIWTEFVKSDKSIFKFIKPFSFLPRNILDYYAAGLQYSKGRTFLTKTYNIPSKYLGNFDVSISKNVWELEGSYYYDLNKEGKNFFYYKWPFIYDRGKVKLQISNENDKKRARRLLANFDGKTEIYFLYLVEIDKISHKYGKKAPETLEKIKEQDRIIGDLIIEFGRRVGGEFDLVIWSDHGFTNVIGEIDLEKGLPSGTYIKFIDSTLARFWFTDYMEKDQVMEALKKMPDVRILTEQDKRTYRIPQGEEYGQILVLAEPGYIFVPNYYQGNQGCKGMHGYDPNKIDLDGVLITNLKINKEEKVLNMVDGYKLLKYGAV